jgi:signal transduction histidine kinase
VPLRRGRVLVKPVLERCVAEVRARSEAYSMRTVTIDVAHDSLAIDADGERFRQMFENLVDNALKFTRAGGSVHISAVDRGAQVLLLVRDNGVGISGDARAHVFEQFYQEATGHVREFGGLGLGLTIAERICSLHGSTIEISSIEGKGTDVLVLWPAAAAVQLSLSR